MKGAKGKLDATRLQELTELCKTLNVVFSDYKLLHQALIHTSYANETKGANIRHNERLEFLGDAVLDLIITSYLFSQCPQLPEGELTKARAQVVCEQTLAKRALELGIGEYLLLGKGEALSGGRERISILADAFEAIIGAVYLDSGFRSAAKYVLHQLKSELVLVERGDYLKDYKTWLQEVVQKNNDSKIAYEVISERGPDHDKSFEVVALVNGERMGSGWGKSKKEAEQHAAKQALIKLGTLTQ
ncbi:ribonuclease III [Sporomusa acidovorans]|uniref:Ribonuclease 3 n=1 Tax=Sporomusa acidovorans (strain ATCC 49682 / DSM 3132 / Mol) TaxID=1123286 RepID=A0ABZ3J2D4_SPOA4|nr:ribonuclease III [Sporomusa acidovorans]OZC20009.1 ribonuclease 3 [Sporomusa acidovorans DSM 3132]SDD47704.1 ribonuclease-3 [Sporomusa acidovorans]